MRVIMAQGTRVFSRDEEPNSRFLLDEAGQLWVINKTVREGDHYDCYCRRATRIEQKIYESEQKG